MKTILWLKLRSAATVGVAALLGVGLAAVAWSAGSTNQSSNLVDQTVSTLIVPGASVGQVRAGMTSDEVAAALGKPEKIEGGRMAYGKRLGMDVLCSSKSGVTTVFCGDSMPQYPGVKLFKGRTKEGIGMGSTRADLIKGLGQPTSAKPWAFGQEMLEYKNLGLSFVLAEGKVFNILVDLRKRK